MGWRALIIIVLLLCTPMICRAGGPAYVAGSGFDPAVRGKPLTWSNGQVQYFTDQGRLSPILNGSEADNFVADALATWTRIPGVAVHATQAGHLAEDVSADNVVGYPDGTYTIPADIQPGALDTPVAIVYDYDGKVTDALLGMGAGGVDYCFTNAVYGGPDNFSADGHLTHALVVINGICAASNSQLPDVRYRLVRTLGRVLGLGWSQANLNVITRNPPPVPDDFAGFPVMHFLDIPECRPIAACYPEPDVPKMDDRAALRRLYPNAADGGFEIQDDATRTGRIFGNVRFTDASGSAQQPMQGVNVVARRLGPDGQPSRRWVATSVSGFAFRGNAGNPINGFQDAHGRRYDFFGSDDPALEGFFDLAGLEFSGGEDDSVRYELSVEPLDANWSEGVGPYSPSQVMPSGSFTPTVVTIRPGADTSNDILMRQSAVAGMHLGGGATYASPAELPSAGGWGAWLSGYGDGDWFKFTAQANRTASITVTALDESGRPNQGKGMPVIGVWPLSDQSGGPAPAATPVPFNTNNFATSRLDAQFLSPGSFRLGIADWRGDGRPDFSYVASMLYADTVLPARISLQGGVATLQGIGFHPALEVRAAGSAGTLLASATNKLLVLLPAATVDGIASLVVSDPANGSFSQMTDVLTFGAAATDQLLLVQGSEPSTPVGAEAANEIRVRVVAADGITPVQGATVAWTANYDARLSACGSASSCSVLSDQSGLSATRVIPTATGVSTIIATLAPQAYASPQSKRTTVVGVSNALDLAAARPTKWIAQDATIDVPLSARVLSLGVPQPGVTVNFELMLGTATLSASSQKTDSSGFANISAHLSHHSSDVQVSACIAPNNAPCQLFTMFATPASLWTLETVSGSGQVVSYEQPFQPLVLRVTDGSAAANPVMGVTVILNTTLTYVPVVPAAAEDDDDIRRRAGMPVLMGSSQTPLLTNGDGLVSMVPTMEGDYGPCEMFIVATAGTSMLQHHMQAIGEIGGANRPAPQVAPRAQRLDSHGKASER